jgi:hypothetical protein
LRQLVRRAKAASIHGGIDCGKAPATLLPKPTARAAETRKCQGRLGFSRFGDQSHSSESFSNIDTGRGLRHVIAAFDRNMITVLSEMMHV